MGGFVSNAECLAESPENCFALAHQLMNECPPQETGDLRSALTKRYLPPEQYTRLLAHSVNGLIERLFGEEVDQVARRQHIPQKLFIPQTDAGMRPLQGENPEDYALRKSQEILSIIPSAEWERMALHAGCSVAAVRHAMWATCFNGAIEERLRT